MRKVIIAVLSLILIALVIIWFVMRLTSGITEVADQFFTAIGQGDLNQAYNCTSQEFQASTSLDELNQFLTNSALIHYSKSNWSSRSVSGNQGELEGSITTSQGGEIPVKLTMIKESSGWKILSIEKAVAGVISEQDGSGIPDLQRQVQLTGQTMYDFALAVNAGNFTDFHKKISQLWQSQISPQELTGIFSSFSEQNIDLTVVKDLEPVFTAEPTINSDNILVLTGYYPTLPSTTTFTLKYIFEKPSWKLFGINVKVE